MKHRPKTYNETMLRDKLRVSVPEGGGGGVLRYISNGDVRSPFLGLKFAI